MCLPIAKYKKIISTLETEIYPLFIKRLDELLVDLQCNAEYESPIQLEKIQLTIDLKTALHSLQSYEIKFIFPLVISLLNNKTNAIIKTDFVQISQLTRYKEDKIEKYSYQLQGLNNCISDEKNHELNVAFDILLEEIQIKLLPLKRQWDFMLNAIANIDNNRNGQCANTLEGKCQVCRIATN